MALGLVDQRLERLPFGGEPEPVVHELGVLRHERVPQVHHLAVHRQGLHLAVRVHEDRAARGLVDAPGFHAYKAVLDQVDPADAVLAAELVQGLEHARGREAAAIDRHAVAAPELELNVLGAVGGVLRGHRELEHAPVGPRRRVKRGVLEDPGLVGNMEEVPVHRIGLLQGGLDGNLVLPAIGDHVRPPRELLAEGVDLPRGDDLEVGGQGHVRELKAALVIALAGGAVGDGVGFFPLRDFDLGLGDQGPRDGGPQVILALVHGVGPDHRVDEVARELLDQVDGVMFRSAGLPGLAGEPLELLLLADVGGERHDLGVVGFPKPLHDDGRVESARVGEDDFHGITF